MLTQHAQGPGFNSPADHPPGLMDKAMDKYLLSSNTYLLLHPLAFVLRPTKIPFHQVHFLKMHFAQWPDLAFVQSLPVTLLLPFKKNVKAHELNNMYKQLAQREAVSLSPAVPDPVSLTQFGG